MGEEREMSEQSKDGKTAVELTEKFIKNVDRRLDIIEKSMWYRWSITIAGIVIFAIVAWIGISHANSAADNATKAAKNANKYATNANSLSVEVSSLLKTVKQQGISTQVERYRAVLDECKSQNQNHNSTIKAIVKLNNINVAKHQISRKRAKANVAQTTFIIDRLQPVRNCKVLAEKVAPLPPGVKAPKH